MPVASLIGNPTWAVVAAISAPVAFAITFLLLSRDPGGGRADEPSHPAYTGPPDVDDDLD